jgi:hypothetical protein
MWWEVAGLDLGLSGFPASTRKDPGPSDGGQLLLAARGPVRLPRAAVPSSMPALLGELELGRAAPHPGPPASAHPPSPPTGLLTFGTSGSDRPAGPGAGMGVGEALFPPPR